MPTVCLKDFLGISLFGRAAGHSINDFVSAFPRFLFDAFPFNHEGLADVGKNQIIIKDLAKNNFTKSDCLWDCAVVPTRKIVIKDNPHILKKILCTLFSCNVNSGQYIHGYF